MPREVDSGFFATLSGGERLSFLMWTRMAIAAHHNIKSELVAHRLGQLHRIPRDDLSPQPFPQRSLAFQPAILRYLLPQECPECAPAQSSTHHSSANDQHQRRKRRPRAGARGTGSLGDCPPRMTREPTEWGEWARVVDCPARVNFQYIAPWAKRRYILSTSMSKIDGDIDNECR